MSDNIDKDRYVGEKYESKCGSYEIIEYIGIIKKKEKVKIRFDLTGTEIICNYSTAYNGFAKDPEYFMYTVKDKIFHSNNCGDFVILREAGTDRTFHKVVHVRFILTGYECDVRYKQVLNGKVKDPTYFFYTVKDKIFHSNNYGDFKIIEHIGSDEYMHRVVRIKFIYSGAEAIVTYNDVLKGEVKDPSFNTVYEAREVFGPTPMTNFERVIYKNWKNMMTRCYKTDDSMYMIYGGRGVTVAPEWHDFETFKRDIISLPGWQCKFNDPINYHLDKDLFQFNLPNNQKVYSKHTCIWLDKSINSKLVTDIINCINVHYGCIYEVIGCNLFFVRVSHLGFPNYGPFNDLYSAINMLNYCYSCCGLYNMIIPIHDNYYMNRQEIFNHTEDRKPMISIIK